MVRLSRISIFFVCIYIACSFGAGNAFGACHAVTPTGAGAKTGANWNNAYAQIPGTQVRGDVYYLADGAYTTTNFSQAASGTTLITIKKAQSYDYGRSSDGCSNDISAGWNANSMGSSQAKFNTSLFSSTYYFINGNGNSTQPGCGGALTGTQTVAQEPPNPSDCGISFTHTGSYTIAEYSGGSHDNFSYVEVIGNGVNANQEFYGGTGMTLEHMFMRNSGCVFLQDTGGSNTVDSSYFWGTEVNGGAACHGQAEFEVGGTNNGIRTNNVYRDITGTAVWTFAASVGTNDTWKFTGNTVYFSPSGAVSTTNGSSGSCPANCVSLTGGDSFVLTAGQNIYLGSSASSTTAYTVGTVYSGSLLSLTSAPGSSSTNYFSVPFGGLSDAALDCINGNLCTNFIYDQNTVVNCITHGAFGSSCGIGFADGASGCSLIAENNLWYSNPGAIAFTKCANMTASEDYNSFLNTSGFGSGPHDVKIASGAPNPLVNWQGGNFSLASDGSDWNNRVVTSLDPLTGPNGKQFTTDRGSYQFGTGNSPGIPTNVTGAAVPAP